MKLLLLCEYGKRSLFFEFNTFYIYFFNGFPISLISPTRLTIKSTAA